MERSLLKRISSVTITQHKSLVWDGTKTAYVTTRDVGANRLISNENCIITSYVIAERQRSLHIVVLLVSNVPTKVKASEMITRPWVPVKNRPNPLTYPIRSVKTVNSLSKSHAVIPMTGTGQSNIPDLHRSSCRKTYIGNNIFLFWLLLMRVEWLAVFHDSPGCSAKNLIFGLSLWRQSWQATVPTTICTVAVSTMFARVW